MSLDLARQLEQSTPIVDLKVTVSRSDLFWYKRQIRDINTECILVALDTYHRNLTRTETAPDKHVTLPAPLDVYLRIVQGAETDVTTGNVTVDAGRLDELDSQMTVYKFDMDEGAILYLEFDKSLTPDRLRVVVTVDERPSVEDFETAYAMPGETGDRKYVIKHPVRAESDDVWFYVGILPNMGDVRSGVVMASYGFRVFKAKCCYWDAADNR